MIRFEIIPEVLRNLKQWVAFTKTIEGKKMPININNGLPASISDENTWSTFEEATKAIQNGSYSMIGFALKKENQLIFIDLDCHTGRAASEEEKEKIKTEYNKLVEETKDIQSYAELSQSGNGIHYILKGELDPKYKSGQAYFRNCLEIYASKRFVIFTGNKINSYDVSDSQEMIEKVHTLQRKYFMLAEKQDKDIFQKLYPVIQAPLRTDEEVIKVALKNKEFSMLWNNKWDEILDKEGNRKFGYQHFADFRLIRYLTFYASNCPSQVDRLFRSSPCYLAYGKNGKWRKYDSDIKKDIDTTSKTCWAIFGESKSLIDTNNSDVVNYGALNYDKILKLIISETDGQPFIKNEKLKDYLINYICLHRNENIQYVPDLFRYKRNVNDCTKMVLSLMGNLLKYSPRLNEFLLYNGKKFTVTYDEELLIHPVLELLGMVEHSVFYWFVHEAILNLDKAAEDRALKLFQESQNYINVRLATDILTKIKGMGIAGDISFYYENPYLNCQNGVLNLKAKELEPHSPSLNLAKITNCDYDPDAKAPVFEKMLSTLLPDEKTRKEFQKAVGLCLVKGAHPAKKIFCVLLGPADSGKTTTLNIITQVLGDYAESVDNSLIMQSKNDKTRGPEFFDLIDRNLITCSEAEKRQSIDAGKIKALTGMTMQSVRNNYSTKMTKFVLTGLIFLDTNHRPFTNDDAVFSRLRVFPFKIKIVKKDVTLQQKLEAERSGILNWILEGMEQVLSDGEVFETEAMLAEKNEYRDDMNVVIQFSKDCLVSSSLESDRLLTTNVHTAFRNYCKQNGLLELSRPNFYEELEKTYSKKKSSKEYFVGVKFSQIGQLYLKAQEMQPQEFAKELRKTREADTGNKYENMRSAYFKYTWPWFAVFSTSVIGKDNILSYIHYSEWCIKHSMIPLVKEDFWYKIERIKENRSYNGFDKETYEKMRNVDIITNLETLKRNYPYAVLSDRVYETVKNLWPDTDAKK